MPYLSAKQWLDFFFKHKGISQNIGQLKNKEIQDQGPAVLTIETKTYLKSATHVVQI